MTLYSVLLLVALVTSFYMARNYGRVVGKSYARLFFLLFGVGFIISITFPGLASRCAHAIGANALIDLVASFTTVAFLGFCASTLAKFKQQERVYVKLVRELALRQAFEDQESQ